MWWPEPTATRRQAALWFLALGACGFQPVHGTGGPGRELRGQVGLVTPATPAGYRLRARLEDRLGRSADPAWTLAVDLEVTEEATAITASGAQTRFTLLGRALWRVSRGREVLAQGAESGFTGYSTTGSTVATEAAAEDARDRLATMLADQLVTRLYALAAGPSAP